MMKRILFFALCALLCTRNVSARDEKDQKYTITPTIDQQSPTGIYIPGDLDDSFKELKKILHPSFIKEIKSLSENDMNKFHRGLGMWLRNNWGLWSGSGLKQYFNTLGIYHPDDMSGIILVSFWRHLNDKPIQVQEQIKYYQEYWKNNETKK